MNLYKQRYLILFLIQEGYNTTKVLLPMVDCSQPSLWWNINKLLDEGYIKIEGTNKFTYFLTKEGKNLLKGKPIIKRYESGFVTIKIITVGRVYYKKFKPKERKD